MAKNYSDRPELARERQDVNAMPRRLSEAETFYGRGIHPTTFPVIGGSKQS